MAEATARDLAILIRDMLHEHVPFECFDWEAEDAPYKHSDRHIKEIDASDPGSLVLRLDDNTTFRVRVTRTR